MALLASPLLQTTLPRSADFALLEAFWMIYDETKWAWRHEQAINDTRLRRPDLIERHGGASQAPPSGARRRDTKANDQ